MWVRERVSEREQEGESEREKILVAARRIPRERAHTRESARERAREVFAETGTIPLLVIQVPGVAGDRHLNTLASPAVRLLDSPTARMSVIVTVQEHVNYLEGTLSHPKSRINQTSLSNSYHHPRSPPRKF